MKTFRSRDSQDYKLSYLHREKRAVENIAKVRHHVLDRWGKREILADGSLRVTNRCLRCGADVVILSKPGESTGKGLNLSCLTPKKAFVDGLESVLGQAS